MKATIAICAVMLLSGCTHLIVTNQTKDGRTFRASAWSFLWDRNLSGLEFDYEKGALTVLDYTTGPDKETLAKGLDVVASGLELMKSAVK